MLGRCLDLVRKRKPSAGNAAVKEEDGKPVTAKSGTTAAQRGPVSGQRADDEKDCADEDYGSDYSGADSLASIDTISDDGSNDGSESDVEKERHWRVRKILKYSRWQRDVDPSTSKGEKRAKDIERRIAKQEEKLRELGANAPRCLETVEEEEYDEPPVTRNPVLSPSS